MSSAACAALIVLQKEGRGLRHETQGVPRRAPTQYRSSSAPPERICTSNFCVAGIPSAAKADLIQLHLRHETQGVPRRALTLIAPAHELL